MAHSSLKLGEPISVSSPMTRTAWSCFTSAMTFYWNYKIKRIISWSIFLRRLCDQPSELVFKARTKNLKNRYLLYKKSIINLRWINCFKSGTAEASIRNTYWKSSEETDRNPNIWRWYSIYFQIQSQHDLIPVP